MTKKFIAGGCSFTLGMNSVTIRKARSQSRKLGPMGCKPQDHEYVCTAYPGSGNYAIARRVFNAVANSDNIGCVS